MILTIRHQSPLLLGVIWGTVHKIMYSEYEDRLQSRPVASDYPVRIISSHTKTEIFNTLSNSILQIWYPVQYWYATYAVNYPLNLPVAWTCRYIKGLLHYCTLRKVDVEHSLARVRVATSGCRGRALFVRLAMPELTCSHANCIYAWTLYAVIFTIYHSPGSRTSRYKRY
jgi:hypothetical protein